MMAPLAWVRGRRRWRGRWGRRRAACGAAARVRLLQPGAAPGGWGVRARRRLLGIAVLDRRPPVLRIFRRAAKADASVRTVHVCHLLAAAVPQRAVDVFRRRRSSHAICARNVRSLAVDLPRWQRRQAPLHIRPAGDRGCGSRRRRVCEQFLEYGVQAGDSWHVVSRTVGRINRPAGALPPEQRRRVSGRLQRVGNGAAKRSHVSTACVGKNTIGSPGAVEVFLQRFQ